MERSRTRAVEMDNIGGLLSIEKMDRGPNELIRELSIVMKGVDERIDGLKGWFVHTERMGNNSTTILLSPLAHGADGV